LATDNSVVTGLSGRYARALFELADDSEQLDAVAEDLRGLSTALTESDDMRRLVNSPVLSRDEQGKAMAAILDAMQVNALTQRAIGLVAQQRRLFVLHDIISDYLRLLAAHKGETTAEVTSARELKSDELEKLRGTLKELVGRDVAVETKVDPGLLGGLVVHIGSRMLDSSIRTKLERLELAMKGAG
jgi:F-type H+-transporting ATPase subunit delta